MKVTKEQAAENRERILDAASRLYRERGFDGIGVSDLMKSAGLTHGGFYGHFSSKEDLITQACVRAYQRSLDKWEQKANDAPEDPVAAITSSYLSARHRDHPETGCLIAALGTDVSRQGPSVRRAVTVGVRSLFDRLASLTPGKTSAVKREKAIATYAGMVGALVLARATDDPELSDEILNAVLANVPKAKLDAIKKAIE